MRFFAVALLAFATAVFAVPVAEPAPYWLPLCKGITLTLRSSQPDAEPVGGWGSPTGW